MRNSKICTCTPVFVKGVSIIAAAALSDTSIFSGSCRPPPQGSLYGSWQRLRPCNHRDSCACRSTCGCHRTGCHSDSQILGLQRPVVKVRIGTKNQKHTSRTWIICVASDVILSHHSPVRPTLLRHMKHLFFLGLGVSPLLSSLLEEATGVGLEAAGWLTTRYNKRQQGEIFMSADLFIIPLPESYKIIKNSALLCDRQHQIRECPLV